MTLLKLPVLLAATMVLQNVDAACVEDTCYTAMYWNPAGVEECYSHFITTVVPPPSTTTVTLTSGIGPITTISGSFVGASTIVPSQPIPTYIGRACFGDVQYRFESACSCIGAGPTITTAPQPVATDTVIVPGLSRASITSPPVISIPSGGGGGPVPEPITVGPGPVPACLQVDLPVVIVTITVDEIVTMSLTVSAGGFCIFATTPALPALPSSLSFLAPSSSSISTGLTFSNTTGPSSTFAFPTFFMTSSRRALNSTVESTSAATESTSAATESTTDTPESTATPTSTPLESTFSESTVSESTVSESTVSESTFSESTVSESTFSAPSSSFSFRNSSTQSPSREPTTTVASSASQTSPSPTASTSAGFVPRGPTFVIKVTGGAYAGQYITTDEPDPESGLTSLLSYTTEDEDLAARWTLDGPTAVLFQSFGGVWFGSYFAFGLRTQWSKVILTPAEDVLSWITTPVKLHEPFTCVIDYMSDNLLTCGSHGWTQLMESDNCGWSVKVPASFSFAGACQGPEELLLQAVMVNPEDEGLG